ERADGLWPLIFRDAKVGSRQAGDRLAFGIGDGGVHLHQVDARRERGDGRRLALHRWPTRQHKGREEQWYNPDRSPVRDLQKELHYGPPWIARTDRHPV